MLVSHLYTYLDAERDETKRHREKDGQKDSQTDGEGGWTSKRETDTEHQDGFYTYNLCP